MGSILQDLHFGIRTLLKSRGMTAVAVITLSLGIGANTAIFSVVDAVLLRPLPFHDSGQLVRLYETESAAGHYPFAGPDFVDWKARARTFEDMTLFSYPQPYNLSTEGRAEHAIAVATESNFFTLLGARPFLGRTLAPDEDEPGHDHVTILSFGLWQSKFGGNAGVIGQTVALDNEKYTVIGVMPASFHYPLEAQLWIPQDMDSKSLHPRGTHGFSALGRLKPGSTIQQAQAELTVIARNLEQQYPQTNHNVGAFVLPMQDDMVAESRSSLLVLLSAVALVLLIACTNVANLLLSRAAARQKEMALRMALGAGRGRLVRQLLTESVLLAFLGAAGGLVVAAAGIRLTSLKLFSIPHINSIQINLPVLGFTLAAATLCGILFGMFPAVHTSRPDLQDELRRGAGSASSSRKRRLTSNTLVVTEVTISVVLLIGSGLLLKDFILLRRNNIGVRTENVWTAAFSLPDSKYSDVQKQRQFSTALLHALSSIPGVDSAAFTTHLPLEGGTNGYIRIRGDASTQLDNVLIESHYVTPAYFHVFGIPLLQGRGFTEEDLQSMRDQEKWAETLFSDGKDHNDDLDKMVFPVIINERMARLFWPKRNPLGQMYGGPNGHGPWSQVVGVVGNVKQRGVASEPAPEAYTSWDSGSYLVLHTAGPVAGLAASVRHEVARLDPGLALYDLRSMDDIIAESAAGEQLIATLIAAFAALALVLAGVGIYGVLSYAVTQRTREIGIRLSLGATRENVLRLVLGQGSRLVLAGFAFGTIAAFAGQRLLASSLHLVRSNDPIIYALAPLCLVFVALLACYLPARRATRVDPLLALRHE
jgi:putative ABC transport system permease protein